MLQQLLKTGYMPQKLLEIEDILLELGDCGHAERVFEDWGHAVGEILEISNILQGFFVDWGHTVGVVEGWAHAMGVVGDCWRAVGVFKIFRSWQTCNMLWALETGDNAVWVSEDWVQCCRSG